MFKKSLSLAAGVFALATAAIASPVTPISSSAWTTNWSEIKSTGAQSLPAATFDGFGTAAVFEDASGDLAFTFQFTNTLGSNEHFTLGKFNDVPGVSITSVGYVNGTGQAPTDFALSDDGSTITFNYGSGNNLGGAASALLVVETNAKNSKLSTYGVIDNSATTAVGYQPAAVPEPASLALIGAGLLGFSLLRRRASKN